MPLEDDFCDIIRKARWGQTLGVADVASAAGLGPLRLEALEAGQMPTAAEVERIAGVLGLRPGPLRAIATGAAQPPPAAEPAGYAVRAVFAGDVGAFAYAVKGPDAAFLVDCGGAADELVRALGRTPDGVLITHGHHDHVGGLAALPPGVPVYAHPELCRRIAGARPLEDGEAVFGLSVRHAPGHSADMLAFVGAGLAFVGDTIFAGSLGRADAPANYPVLLETARRLLSVPGATRIYCGHGPVTSVAWERQHNAFPIG